MSTTGILSSPDGDRADGVLRAVTDDSTFRVITVRTRDTVRGVVAAQRATGNTAKLLADLVTGAVLVREAMAPDLRVQVILQSESQRSRIVADAHPDGSCRGLVQMPEGHAALTVASGDLFQVARTLHNGALQQGTVSVGSGGVSEGLMQYMQLSEQTVTMCAVGCNAEGDEIASAGGYLVQLLPEVLDPSGPLVVGRASRDGPAWRRAGTALATLPRRHNRGNFLGSSGRRRGTRAASSSIPGSVS